MFSKHKDSASTLDQALVMISPPTFISRATSSSVCIKRVSDHLRFRFPFSLRDRVLNSRWLWIFYSQEFFLKGYCWFWQPLLCRRLLNIIGLPLKTRHFQTKLGQVVFKLKKPKVPVVHFILISLNWRYNLLLQKVARESCNSWKSEQQVLSTGLCQFGAFLLLFRVFHGTHIFKFAASPVMNN